MDWQIWTGQCHWWKSLCLVACRCSNLLLITITSYVLSQPTFDCKVHMAMVAIMITSYEFSHLTSRQGLQLETYCFYTFGLTIHIVLMIVDFQGVILALLVRAMLPPNWELHRQGINRPYKHSSPLSSKPHYPSPLHSVRDHSQVPQPTWYWKSGGDPV